MSKDNKEDVTTLHPEYRAHMSKWSVTRDVVRGDVEHYLPVIDANDPDRQKLYKKLAVFSNFTKRTRIGLVGSANRKAAEVNLPPSLAYLEIDADGNENTLQQMIQKSEGDAIEVGRQGLLVDFPTVEGTPSAADAQLRGLRPTIKAYSAESIINWDTVKVGSGNILTLLVLEEKRDVVVNRFEHKTEKEYRVLELRPSEDGLEYWQSRMNDKSEIIDVPVRIEANGRPLDRIPFQFIGSDNNDSEIDAAPLEGIAEINLGHYINSADYEESLHIAGQPMVAFSTSWDIEEWNAANEGNTKVRMGARVGYNLGEGGKMEIIQAQAEQALAKAMDQKEQQMIAMGARIMSPNTQVETAEAARINNSTDNSALLTIVQNVQAAYTQALKWCSLFLGAVGDIKLKLNTEFYEEGVDPNELNSLILLMEKKVIARPDVRSFLRERGRIEEGRTDEDLDEDIENDAHLGQEPTPITVEDNRLTNPVGDDNVDRSGER